MLARRRANRARASELPSRREKRSATASDVMRHAVCVRASTVRVRGRVCEATRSLTWIISHLHNAQPDRMYNQTDFYRSAFSPSLISSMDDFASPNTMFVFELKNSGFSTSAYPPASDRFSTSTFCDRHT